MRKIRILNRIIYLIRCGCDLKAFSDKGVKLEKGEVLPTAQGNIEIIDADETTITIANNHALAGKKLFFEIEVIDIK